MSGEASTAPAALGIKAIDGTSVHRITSGQVVIDLQTAVKELVENSLDAGATSIEVRFKDFGLQSIEVIDNGSGIPKDDYPNIALKHHTSKLSTFEDLTAVTSFGFRGEALSSLCALSESVTFTTAMAEDAPMGTILEFDKSGKLKNSSGKVARQRGTTATVTGIFTPLPVRRKELERNIKREFAKVLNLLNAYALVPCSEGERGVRLVVYNQPDKGRRTIQLRTDGTKSLKAAVSSLWGPKTLENLVPLELELSVDADKSLLKRSGLDEHSTDVRVTGLISRFSIGCGRTGTDRQFLYVNGRPWNASKIQKAFNEIYRTFNINQSPFIAADFQIPTTSYDVNVSPDKRTILIHSEANLISALKDKLESVYADARSTYSVNPSPTMKLSSREKSTSSRTTPSVGSSSNSPGVAHAGSSKETPIEDITPESEPVEVPRTRIHVGKDVPFDTDLSDLGSPPSTEITKQVDVPSKLPLFIPDSPPAENDTLTSPNPVANSVQRSDAFKNSSSNAQQTPNEEPQGDYEKIRHVVSPVGTKTIKYSATSAAQKPIQMVLSTSKASWSLEKRDSTSRKRSLEGSGLDIGPRQKKLSFQAKLSGFSRRGSLTEDVRMDEPDEQDWDEDEDVVDEEESRHHLESSKSRRRNLSDLDDVDVVDRDVQLEIENDPDADKDEDPSIGHRTAIGGKPRKRRSSAMSVDQVSEADPFYADVDAPIADERPPSAMSVDVIDLTAEDDHSINPTSPMHSTGDRALAMDAGIRESIKEGKHKDGKELPEVVRSVAASEAITITCDMSAISSYWKSLPKDSLDLNPSPSQPNTVFSQDASYVNANTDGSAERELSRIIHKEDFTSMEIIGQFNLGFIVVRRKSGIMQDSPHSSPVWDDLFLIDQHAADEKYNFETLQQTTRIQSQRLLHPRPLELSAADEVIALENLDVLKQNGFEVDVDEEAPLGQQRKIMLVAQPTSKDTVFDMKDLEELIHLMHDRPAGQMVRCSKARRMFASRACRKSFMIGTAMTTSQMTSVVRHMATMDQPWACPHGRPTMRHLTSIQGKGLSMPPVDWSSF